MRDWHILYLFNIVLLVGLGLAFRFWRREARADERFFTQQKWSVFEAAVYLIAFTLILMGMSSARSISLVGFTRFLFAPLAIVVMLASVWTFFRYVNQPFSILEERSNRTLYLVAVGVAYLSVVAIVGASFVLWLPAGIVKEMVHDSGTMRPWLERYGQLTGIFLTGTFFLAVSTASIFEEIVFRGILYSALRRQAGQEAAMVISSLIFMLMHNCWGLSLFAFGLVFAYLYERYHSLIPGIIVHLGWNLIQVSLWNTGLAFSFLPKTYFRGVIVAGIVGLAVASLMVYISKRRTTLPLIDHRRGV